jgi:hypothetical protein
LQANKSKERGIYLVMHFTFTRLKRFGGNKKGLPCGSGRPELKSYESNCFKNSLIITQSGAEYFSG